MDPLSIAGAILGLLGLVSTGTSLAKTLYHIASRAGPIHDEIQSFANHISQFSKLLKLTYETFEKFRAKKLNLNVANRLTQEGVFEHLRRQTRLIFNEIKNIKPFFRSLKQGFDWIVRLKWVLNKARVEALGLEIDRIKSTLAWIIALSQFEYFVSSDLPMEDILMMKNQMKIAIGNMRRVTSQIEQSSNIHLQHIESLFESQRADIEHTMRKIARQVVSRYKDLPSSTRSPTTERTSSSSQNKGPSGDTQTLGRSNQPTIGLQPDSSRHERVRRSPDVIKDNVVDESGGGQTRPVVPATKTHDASLIPAHEVAEPDGEKKSMRIHGLINGRPAEAMYSDSYEVNFISQTEAVEYGLEIQPRNGDSGFVVFSWNDQEGVINMPSIGKVEFHWQNNAHGHSFRPPFMISCVVIENLPTTHKHIGFGLQVKEDEREVWRGRATDNRPNLTL